MNITNNTFSEVQKDWFTPIQMLEPDACSRCQECMNFCPVVQIGYEGGAMTVLSAWRSLRKYTGLMKIFFPKGDFHADLSLVSKHLTKCTTCNLCSVVCESGINLVSLWESMRGTTRDLGMRDPVTELRSSCIIQKKNPYEQDPKTRTDWYHRISP